MASSLDEDGSGRARVCEPCRRSKVKCEQQDPTRPCKRCAKSWRVCIPASRSQPPSKPSPPHSQLKMLEDRVHRLITICESNGTGTPAGEKKDSEVTAEEGVDWWANEPFPPSPWSRRQGCQIIRRGDEGPIRSKFWVWVHGLVNLFITGFGQASSMGVSILLSKRASVRLSTTLKQAVSSITTAQSWQ